jgi:dTDP-D-glucose 4,6-dehydratase
LYFVDFELNSLMCSPIHGNGSNVRAFLYVTDVANAFELILHKGDLGMLVLLVSWILLIL